MTSPSEARQLEPDECWRTTVCYCTVCCGPRNLACVFFGPQRGARAMFCHQRVWPKNDSLRLSNFSPRSTCYNCLSKLTVHHGTWQCEDKRRAARASRTVRVTPYLAYTQTRALTEAEMSRNIMTTCDLEWYECPKGCDSDSAELVRACLNRDGDVCPALMKFALER